MGELYSTEGDYGLRTLSEPDEALVEYSTPQTIIASSQVNHNDVV